MAEALAARQVRVNPQVRPAHRYAQSPMPYALQTPVHSERVIKKSRFIGCVDAMPNRPSLVTHMNEAGQGQVVWLDDAEDQTP